MSSLKCTELLIVLLFVAATGCSTVTSTERLGEDFTAADGDIETFDGVWVAEDNAFYIKSLGDDQLRIGTVDWGGGRYVVDEWTAFITKDDSIEYLNIANMDSTKDKQSYMFFPVLRRDRQTLVLLFANKEGFKKAVEDGLLKGVIEGSDVTIRAAKDQLDAFVTPAEFSVLFDLKKPLVLRRVADLGY